MMAVVHKLLQDRQTQMEQKNREVEAPGPEIVSPAFNWERPPPILVQTWLTSRSNIFQKFPYSTAIYGKQERGDQLNYNDL